MPSFNDYVIFADESGDHSLSVINPDYPVFVLAVCLFDRNYYETNVAKWVNQIKVKYFGNTDVILHERDIRKATKDFRILNDLATRTAFCADIDRLMKQSKFTLIASVIRKRELMDRYVYPDNPYHLSAGFCLERLTRHLKGLGCTEGRAPLVFERRGGREDAELELECRRVCDGGNYLNERLPFDIRFESKRHNSPGLQFADLIARPIGRHIIDPAQSNRAYDILEKKFRKSWWGKVSGYGCKIFP